MRRRNGISGSTAAAPSTDVVGRRPDGRSPRDRLLFENGRLVRGERAVRPPSDHVGEGAAAVESRIPLRAGAIGRSAFYFRHGPGLTRQGMTEWCCSKPAGLIKSNRYFG